MSEDFVKKKRGRPVGKDSKNNRLHIRINDNMNMRLDRLCMMTGMTRTDIFEEAFNNYEKTKLLQTESEVDKMSEDSYDDGYYDGYDYFDDEYDDEYD